MTASIASRAALCNIIACLLVAFADRASALDPALDASQYGHTAWRIRDGFTQGRVLALAQTSDGYLWLGTEVGLLRFDGVRTVPWRPPAGASLPDTVIRALLAARDDTLWIGTTHGLASWKAGKLTRHTRFEGATIDSIVEDREGVIWVGAQKDDIGSICAISGASTECEGPEGSLGQWVNLYQQSNGTLWAVTSDRVWRWNPGQRKTYLLPDPASGAFQGIGETASDAVIVVTQRGMYQIVGENVEPFPLPLAREAQPTRILRDRDRALWIGTRGGGLLHVHQGRIDTLRRDDGISGDSVTRLFEDREGSVWVATSEGLDRFRAVAAPTYTAGQAVQSPVVSVAADRDGNVWLSTRTGIVRIREGRVEDVTVRGLPENKLASLFEDSHGRLWLGFHSGLAYVENGSLTYIDGVPGGYIDSIAEDRHGDLWIANREAGLVRLSVDRKIERIPWTKIDAGARAWRLADDPVRGGVWLGLWPSGVSHFAEGRVDASYTARDGLGGGRVAQVTVAADGTVWVATEGGLSRIKGGRIATLDSRVGLPCDNVHSMIDDDEGSTWLYMTCGLVRIARSDLAAWAAAADNARAAPTIHAMVLDASDGVRSVALLDTWSPHVARSRDGKLWFVATDGVTVIDPRQLALNKLPPPVHVEQIAADRTRYEAASPVRLPPLVRDLEIDYTATSLVAPEKVLFRYKLEGHDRDWQDAGNRRQAFYGDLTPGDYRFRVIACNNSGVWNEEGASLAFSIAPAYWQTNWFRALCVLALIALLVAAYRLRVRQLARSFNRTLEARVDERTRIARELHDTLLQSFHGLLLRFQTVVDLLPGRAAEAKQLLASTIDQAAEAITEGRDAVQGLRTSTTESNDLAVALRALGEELAAEESGKDAATMQVEVQGAPKALHPIVRDEVFRIAGEALRNAFRHAQAKQIEVELRYDERRLRLRVRDDGKGIDPSVLGEGGREGHFGLVGMRERAKLIGGKLTVWSALDAGTEVELSIPAAQAYGTSSSRRPWLAEKLSRQSTTSDS